MPKPETPEGLVRFAHAIVESPHLPSWFYSLETIAESQRGAAFLNLATHIAEEDPDLALTAFKLRHPKIYQTVLAAVREIVDEADHDI